MRNMKFRESRFDATGRVVIVIVAIAVVVIIVAIVAKLMRGNALV
jgi:hypothetical protein